MRIYENNRAHLSDFIRLNEQWISKYFELEAADHALAVNPHKIIDDGGFIFTLAKEDSVIATCALFNEGEGVYELARMAVEPAYQRNGHGEALLLHAFAKLDAVRAIRVYLNSNTKLESAIALYKKHGFETFHLGPHPTYSRANIIMERILAVDEL